MHSEASLDYSRISSSSASRLSISTQVTLNPGLSSFLQSTLYSVAGRDLGGVSGSIGGISPVR